MHTLTHATCPECGTALRPIQRSARFTTRTAYVCPKAEAECVKDGQGVYHWSYGATHRRLWAYEVRAAQA